MDLSNITLSLISCVVILQLGLVVGDGFSIAESYGDHMVLQCSPMSAKIWGFGLPGYNVSVYFNERVYNSTVALGNNRTGWVWSVSLQPTLPGGPYNITVVHYNNSLTIDNTTATLTDVLFGDVWVCGGQSNMEFILAEMFEAKKYLNDSVNFPNIRVFGVGRNISPTPVYDVVKRLNWSLPSPESLGGDGYEFSYFSAICWVFGVELYNYLGYPIGLVEAPYGGTPIKTWMSPGALAECTASGRYRDNKDNPSRCWNGMIVPILNMSIYGAIFYQGESDSADPNYYTHHQGEADATDPTSYDCEFQSMIKDWRAKFNTGHQFPFGFVQLSSRMLDPSVVSGYPAIRWKQTANYGYAPNPLLENTFMAVAMDLGDVNSPLHPIHPRYKVDVGKRLALGAEAVAYGDPIITYQGPYPTSILLDYTKNKIQIEFTNGSENLFIQNSLGMEVRCEHYLAQEDLWFPTEINGIATDKSSITFNMTGPCGGLRSDSPMYRVVGIRYAWRDSPCSYKNCAMYSVNSKLPVPSFYTPIPVIEDTVYTVWVNDVLPKPVDSCNRI